MTRALRAAAAAAIIATLLLVPPLLLLSYIGNPWPAEGVSLAAPLTDGAITGALALVVWVLWAQMAWCLVAETTAMLTKDRVLPPVSFTFGAQQHLARRLVSAVVLATIAAPLVASLAPTGADAATEQTSAAGAWQTALVAPVASPTGRTAAGDRTERTAPPSEVLPPTTSSTASITVMRLDSLWSIAERTLGDGERWREIADLNEGDTMTDGSIFRTSAPLQPGWRLSVPGDVESTKTTGHRRVVVEAGDTLTQIAADELGDASRYEDIFRASTAITQPGGRHLVDPDVIDVGWTLKLPGEAAAARPVETLGKWDEDPPALTEQPLPFLPLATPPQPVPSAGLESPTPTDTTSPHLDEGGDLSVVSPGVVTDPAETDVDSDSIEIPWMLAGLAGTGALLGGGLHLAVRSRRRRQVRGREPGRVLSRVDPALVEVDKSVWVSETAATSLEDLDLGLRNLAADRAEAGLAMPSLAAVELASNQVTLHLSTTTNLASPWIDRDGDGLRWSSTLQVAAAAEANHYLSGVDPPYPLLATVGTSSDGATWLINLEELGHLSLTGDAQRCADLARYMVGELALSPWAEQTKISCVGLVEKESLASDRVSFHDASQTEDVVASFIDVATATEARARQVGGSPTTGRTGQLDDDVWQAHCLLVFGPQPAPTLDELRELLEQRPRQSGTALVEVNADRETAGVKVNVGPDGRVDLPQFGLHLRVAGLSVEEARGCSALLRSYDDLAAGPVRCDQESDEGWQPLADLGGAAREEWTTPREGATREDIAELSLLPESDALYVERAAVEVADIQRLAPVTPRPFIDEVAAADPTLDQDVADWFDDTCHRPRLTLLGPVSVKAYGVALAKRKPYFTEMLTYLALRRRHGVTAADLADVFSIEVRKARIYVNTLRDWLGADPQTGALHLPHADKSPSAHSTGVAAYQVSERLLIDSELFQRLRLRGQSRGAAGMADLSRALEFVVGVPFDQLRPGGWSWLLDGERVDLYASAAAADVALVVATDALARNDLATARRAAQAGLLAAPDEDASELTMACVLSAEGGSVEAASRVKAVQNRIDDDDPPEDLTERNRNIARRLEQSG